MADVECNTVLVDVVLSEGATSVELPGVTADVVAARGNIDDPLCKSGEDTVWSRDPETEVILSKGKDDVVMKKGVADDVFS